LKYAQSIAGSAGVKIAANGNIDAVDCHKHVPFTMLAMDLKFAGQRACHRSEHCPLLAKNALPSNNHIASSWTRAKLFAGRKRAGEIQLSPLEGQFSLTALKDYALWWG
jgi:hypothetical protein